MPPQVTTCRPLLTPLAHFSAPVSPVSNKIFKGTKKMKVPGKNLILLLVFILTILSILRLLRLAITTTSSHSPPSSSSLLSTLQNMCSSPSPLCGNVLPTYSPKASALTKKEFKLLSNLITSKAPCNLLIFGLEPQYLELSETNAKGITIFLEDDSDKINNAITRKSNRTQIHKVEYQTPAKDAYKLLKHARKNPICVPRSGHLQASKCKLTLKDLPREVLMHKWDKVILVGHSYGGLPVSLAMEKFPVKILVAVFISA